MLRGNTIAFHAFVVEPDGIGQTASTASWSVDNAAVATVSTTGTVMAVGAGQTTLTAVVGSSRASRMITVLPNYNGAWSGALYIEQCAPCPLNYVEGFSTRVAVRLVHTTDELNGAVTISGYPIPVSGRIDPSGRFAVDGSLSQPPPFTLTETVSIVDGELDGAMRLRGTVTYTTFQPQKSVLRGRLTDLTQIFSMGSRR